MFGLVKFAFVLLPYEVAKAGSINPLFLVIYYTSLSTGYKTNIA